MNIRAKLGLTALVAVGFSSLAQAYDWPQWRGPNRDDLSKETNLLDKWPASGPERAWLYSDGGAGYSGFAVADGRLITMGADESTESVYALDATTGEPLWSTEVGPRLSNGWGDGPRSTPTIDGDHTYALGGEGNLVCVKSATGKKVWEKSLTEDFGGSVPNWGYTESVLVDGDVVVCTPGGSRGAIVALNKTTGATVWATNEFKDGAQYSSIIKATILDKPQYIQRTMESLVGVDPANGKILWKTDFPGRTAMIPTPIVQGDMVYITGGYGTGCKTVRIKPGFEVEEVYSNRLMKNHHGGVILLDGNVYGFSDGVGWLCQDLESGDEVWSDKSREAIGKGAVSYADGKLYLVGEDTGDIGLLNATAEGYQEVSRFTLEPQSEIRSSRGKIWVHPVIANGKLYLRDQDMIYCYNVAAN